jgi:hypothetical protein
MRTLLLKEAKVVHSESTVRHACLRAGGRLASALAVVRAKRSAN